MTRLFKIDRHKAIFHLLKHGVRGSFSSNCVVFCQSFHQRLVVLVDLEK